MYITGTKGVPCRIVVGVTQFLRYVFFSIVICNIIFLAFGFRKCNFYLQYWVVYKQNKAFILYDVISHQIISGK